MPLTIDSVPGECLNGADDCLLIAFTTDNLLESAGSLDPVVINEADAGDFQIGTTIAINSAIFSLSAAANPATNEVTFNAVPAIMLLNLETILNANYYIQKNYTVQIVGTELQLTPKKATLQTDVVFENLTGASSTKESSFLANPVQVRNGYSAKVCLMDADTSEELGEVRMYAIPKANDDFTNIVSYRLDKDVAAVVKKSLLCPLPNLETAVEPAILPVSGLVRNVTFTAAEAYGAPLNHYQELTNPTPFAVLNGGARKDESLTGRCSGFINLEGSEVKVSCNQPFWLYKYVEHPAVADIYTHQVEFYDASGTSLGNKAIDTETGNNGTVFLFESGLPQMTGSLASLGIDVEDVARYRITVVVTNAGFPQDTDFVDFYVTNFVEPEVLIFKTSLGTFSSLPVQALSSAVLNGAQEFIQLCTPCGSSQDEKGTYSIRVNDTFDLSFILFNWECYDQRMIEELFLSEEVYWLRGSLFYHLQPTNEDVPVYLRRTNINPVYNAKLYY